MRTLRPGTAWAALALAQEAADARSVTPTGDVVSSVSGGVDGAQQ